MTTLSHERSSPRRLFFPELWASIAISTMWLAVLVVGVWGPDFVSRSPGGSETIIPSAILVAPFAFLATRSVSRYAFRPDAS
jgi:hypothetical protein